MEGQAAALRSGGIRELEEAPLHNPSLAAPTCSPPPSPGAQLLLLN